MTTLEKIIRDLSNMDEQQLEEVSALITTVTLQAKPVPCDRKNIQKFIQQVRQKHPKRSIQEIDQSLRMERDSWDN